MSSTTDTFCVARRAPMPALAAPARTRSILRILFALLMLAVLVAPVMAQEQGGGGEANLKLPDLNSAPPFLATFGGGIGGRPLLMGGLVVSALGFVFGLMIFVRLRNMPV